MKALQKLLFVGGIIYVVSRMKPKQADKTTTTPTGFTGGGGGGSTTPTPIPETPTNGYFTTFELTDLKDLISGTNDIATKNTLGYEVFPNVNGQPQSNLFCKFLWGNGVEFQNHSGDTPPIALSKGLATGFDNSFLNTITGVPAEHRYKWTLFDNPVMWAKTHLQLESEGASQYNAFKNQSRDSNNTLVPFRYTMLDIEAGVSDLTKIASFVKGYYEAARADNPNHIVILYTYKMNQGGVWPHNGYFYSGDSVTLDQSFFPVAKPGYQSTIRTGTGVVQDYFKGKDILLNVLVSYPKQNLPLLNYMYEKDGDGNFVLSGGRRVLKTNSFTEVQRGETISFSAAGNEVDISVGEGQEYGKYRLKSELFHAINQFAGLYSEVFYRMQMLANMSGLGYDFQNIHNVNTFKMTGVLRHDLEANPFTNLYRPLDRLTSEWFGTLVYTLLNNLTIWTGVTGGNVGLTKAGAWIDNVAYPDLNKTSSEGSPFPGAWFGDGAGSPKTLGHLGSYRQWGAKMFQIQAENRVYGLWQKTDKVLAFCNPDNVDGGQFPIVGRLQGNVLKLHGVESRLELGESITILVKNVKNAEVFTETMNAKLMLNKLFVLPVDTYNAQDIYVQYINPVTGGLQKVNGRAENIA